MFVMLEVPGQERKTDILLVLLILNGFPGL